MALVRIWYVEAPAEHRIRCPVTLRTVRRRSFHFFCGGHLYGCDLFRRAPAPCFSCERACPNKPRFEPRARPNNSSRNRTFENGLSALGHICRLMCNTSGIAVRPRRLWEGVRGSPRAARQRLLPKQSRALLERQTASAPRRQRQQGRAGHLEGCVDNGDTVVEECGAQATLEKVIALIACKDFDKRRPVPFGLARLA